MKLFDLYDSIKANKNKKSIYVNYLDIIQNEVDKLILSKNGFKRSGRTHNKVTSDGLILVINYQIGQSYKFDNDKFWINFGIRVPESFNRSFKIENPKGKFYYDYDCNIRPTVLDFLNLNSYKGFSDKYYILSEKNISENVKEIVNVIDKYVFPLFDDLDNRDKIIKNSHKYKRYYFNPQMIDVDLAMIYGAKGDIINATKLFQKYYDSVIDHKSHIEYLEKLAEDLNIKINKKHN